MKKKKSLGQNFLKNKAVVVAMANRANLSPYDVVLEAGPGEGILTEELLKWAGKVIAVEKDNRLIPFLTQKFSSEISSGKLNLIHSDILHFDPLTYKLTNLKTYKLIANLPYYITGAFLKKFLSGNCQPSMMMLLLQKEVVKRIIARDGKESILSISVKAYGAPRLIKKVPAGSFAPAPKVDSAVLLIDNISKQFFDGFSEEEFFQVVKTAFAHKRKRLAGNLKTLYPQIESALEKLNIPKNARAENISLGDWKKLTIQLKTTPVHK